MWTLEDKKDYVNYLNKEYRREKAQPDTIAKMVNLNNIQADVNSINLTY